MPLLHSHFSIQDNKIYITRHLLRLILTIVVLTPAIGIITLVTSIPSQTSAQSGTCGNGVCDPGEATANCYADCGCQGSYCGDGFCGCGEFPQACNVDCNSCGDGFCGWGEHCSNCVADCGTCPYCGDGACNNGETCATCSGDCGVCIPNPVATDDSATTDEDVPITVDVLANDTTPAGTLDPSTVTVTTAAAHGATAVNATTGAITYTPATDYFGSDQYVYRVCHTLSRCDTATVSITINPVNDPPYATDDTASTAEDTPVDIDVLANDYDDGSLDPASLSLAADAQHGSTAIDLATGTITYTPSQDYAGADSFSYQVCDDTALCSTATVSVTITPVDDPPTANPDDVSVLVNTPATFDPIANDTDPDSVLDSCAIMLITSPAHGAASLTATCQTTYTPAANYTGTDTFEYQICDDTGLCDNAAVNLTISTTPPPQSTSPPSITVGDPAVSKAGPATAATIGELVPWSITVSNSGTQTTEAYTFSDPVPPMFDIRDVVVNGKAAYSISGNTITFNVEPLAPGEQVHITVNTVANQQASPGQACNSLAPSQSANTTACAMLFPSHLPETGQRHTPPVAALGIGLAIAAGISLIIVKRKH